MILNPLRWQLFFWYKVKEKVVELMEDPEIRDKVESELNSNDKVIQADTPASDWWTW